MRENISVSSLYMPSYKIRVPGGRWGYMADSPTDHGAASGRQSYQLRLSRQVQAVFEMRLFAADERVNIQARARIRVRTGSVW